MEWVVLRFVRLTIETCDYFRGLYFLSLAPPLRVPFKEISPIMATPGPVGDQQQLFAPEVAATKIQALFRGHSARTRPSQPPLSGTVTASSQALAALVFPPADQLHTIEKSAAFLSAAVPSRREGPDILEHVMSVRKHISKAESPPIDTIVGSSLVPILNDLTLSSDDVIVREALWVLTNIASGNASHVACLLAAGSHLRMITCLASSNVDVVEQAVWALGNIAGDGPAPRDTLLRATTPDGTSLLTALIQLYIRAPHATGDWTKEKCGGFRKNTLWTLSNCCRGKPQPAIDLIRPMFDFLCGVLASEEDNESVLDALWCVSYISDGPNERIQLVLDSGLLEASIARLRVKPPFTNDNPMPRPHDYVQDPTISTGMLSRVMTYLPHAELRRVAFLCKDVFFDVLGSDEELFSRAQGALTSKYEVRNCVVRTIGNVVTGTDDQTERALQLGVVDLLAQIACPTEKEVLRKEVNWTISNITAGSAPQIARCTRNDKLMQFLRASLYDTSVKVIREGMWAISNATDRGTDESMHKMCSDGLLFAFVAKQPDFLGDARLHNCGFDGIANLHRFASNSSLASDEIANLVKMGVERKQWRDMSAAAFDKLKQDPAIHPLVTNAARSFWYITVPYIYRTCSAGQRFDLFAAGVDSDLPPAEQALLESIKDMMEPEEGEQAEEHEESEEDEDEEDHEEGEEEHEESEVEGDA